MKTIFTIITAVILTASVFAQSPEKMSYQAVIRDADNNLVTSQAIGMQISILQSSANGTVVYTETQNLTSNANGLVSVEIGTGTTSDDFSSIDWANGPYFIKTETDPAGGTSYTITGTSQLLSVPYALHAKTAESVTGGITETDPVFTAWDKDYADLTNKPTTITSAQADAILANEQAIKDTASQIRAAITDVSSLATKTALADTAEQIRDDLTPRHYIGEYWVGGIVFYVDHTGKHGLMVATEDQATSAPWGQVDVPLDATSTWNGEKNSETVAASASAGDAVKLALDYKVFSGDDYYLPSTDEFNLLFNARYEVNKTLKKYNSELVEGNYWSSTVISDGNAMAINFSTGVLISRTRESKYSVRAIRKF